MFIKVKDILQIRGIEKAIGRNLTEIELAEINTSGELLVNLANGDWYLEKIIKYDLDELLSVAMTEHVLHEADNRTPDQKSIFTPKISCGTKFFTRQEFSFDRQKIDYFESVLKCLAEMEMQGKFFDEPTDQFIMSEYYIWGETDTSISEKLRSEEGKQKNLKPWSQQYVGKRRKQITKGFGIKPMTIFR